MITGNSHQVQVHEGPGSSNDISLVLKSGNDNGTLAHFGVCQRTRKQLDHLDQTLAEL